MNVVLQLIQDFLAGRIHAWAFSCAVEDYLLDHYDEMKAENAAAAEILNDNLPDICGDCEPGISDEAIFDRVNAEYQRVLSVLD